MPGNKSSQPICKLCGQPILGSYFTALGGTWHPEHFVCAACNQPISDARFNVHEGVAYHSGCYRDRVAPRCASCGKPLLGEYLSHGGATYHSECYRDRVAPRCAYCHEPLLGQFVRHDGIAYHSECYRDRVAPRCAYCHEPLLGKYLEDHWGTNFCEKHRDEYPTCSFCGRLVPPQQQKAGAKSNGDIRCPICIGSAIETPTEAQPIFTRMQRWVKSQGLTYANLPFSLELCDRTKLTQLLKGRGGTDTLGVTLSTIHTLNGQEVRTEINGIAVLKGLPSTLFQGVLVHELGHVWLVLHGVKGLPSWAEEGFCELLSHRYYTELATVEAGYHAKGIEQSSDPVYGEGFRRVRSLANSIGFQRLVETLATTKRLPT